MSCHSAIYFEELVQQLIAAGVRDVADLAQLVSDPAKRETIERIAARDPYAIGTSVDEHLTNLLADLLQEGGTP